MLPTIFVFLAVIGQAFSAYLYNSITSCQSACGSFGRCVMQISAYECQCADQSLVFTGRLCEPCPVPCAGGICDVQPTGAATCQCPPGTTYANGQCFNAQMECQINCINGNCQFFNGQWRCVCPQGLVLIQGACRPCPVPCQNGQCQVNPDGSATCLCPQDSSYVNGQCVSNYLLCQQQCVNGFCVRTWAGSWQCTCPQGSTLVNGQCIDNQIICQQQCLNGICQPDGLGNWQCTCPPGFQFQGGTCVDINECATGMYCANGQCINEPGSFRCICNPGFQPAFDNKSCRQIFYPCICNGGMCINVGGVAQCVCPYGFILEGTSQCNDINECLGDPCQGGQCSNYPGGHACLACLPGFVLSPDGKSCITLNTGVIEVPRPGTYFPWWLFTYEM